MATPLLTRLLHLVEGSRPLRPQFYIHVLHISTHIHIYSFTFCAPTRAVATPGHRSWVHDSTLDDIHHVAHHPKSPQVMTDCGAVYASSCQALELRENLKTSSHLDIQQLLASSWILGIMYRPQSKRLNKTFTTMTTTPIEKPAKLQCPLT